MFGFIYLFPGLTSVSIPKEIPQEQYKKSQQNHVILHIKLLTKTENLSIQIICMTKGVSEDPQDPRFDVNLDNMLLLV